MTKEARIVAYINTTEATKCKIDDEDTVNSNTTTLYSTGGYPSSNDYDTEWAEDTIQIICKGISMSEVNERIERIGKLLLNAENITGIQRITNQSSKSFIKKDEKGRAIYAWNFIVKYNRSDV